MIRVGIIGVGTVGSHVVKILQENEDIDAKIEELSKRYGEIMLPEYDENKRLIYSEQFGLVISDKK